MADQDPDDKLALPKLGLRRRKRDAPPVEETPVEETPVDETPVDETPVDETPEETPSGEAPTEVIAAQPEVEEEQRPTELFADEPEHDDRPTEVLTAAVPPPVTREEPAAPPRERRELSVPHVDARAGAVFAGLVSGLVGVGLTAGFQKGCEAVRGTGSCGGVGLLLLIVVLIAMTFVGSALLRAFQIPDTLSTSFLGVGLLAVVTLVFLLGSIDRWWMVVVIPLVAAVTFLLSWWASAKFGSTDDAPAVVKETVDS